MRLEIRPGLYRLWRAPGRLQIGLDARLGTVLDGLTSQDEYVISLLDGSLGLKGLLQRARRLGLSTERVQSLLAALREADLLVPRQTSSQALAQLDDDAREALEPEARTLSVTYPAGDGWDVVLHRRGRSVAVVGAGRTGLALACNLARAGVGTVLVDDDTPVALADLAPGGYRTEDLGHRRDRAAAGLLSDCWPHVRTHVADGHRPDLLVLVSHGGVDPRRTETLLREDVPHLAVVLRERAAVVGPLVRPGSSACLRCLDLHRRDRDPEWPRLVPQLPGVAQGGEETALAALASSMATAQALAHLDEQVAPASVDATIEMSLPDGLAAVRPWSTHPECGCTWPPGGRGRGRFGRPRHAQPVETDTMGA
jgi:hypothetical protein